MTESSLPDNTPLEPATATAGAGNGGDATAPGPPPGPSAPPATPAVRAAEERNWAMLCHLSTFAGLLVPLANIFAPLVVWALKRQDFPLVDHHGKEAINFQISITLYLVIALLFSFLLIGIPFLLGLLVADLVLTIIAAVRAADGESYEYPLTIRLVR